jgi:hypothetical protein
MNTNIYLRKCEIYTVKRSSDPIEIDVEKLRKCKPIYNGNTNKELMEYLNENVFYNEEWCEVNKEIYDCSEITGEYLEIENEYFDSRVKGVDEWMELGIPDEKYSKNGFFKTYETDP